MATEADDIDEVQGWCPECKGSGMVMEGEPVDCPNIRLHKALESMKKREELLSRWEAAALLGITILTLKKLEDSKLIEYDVVMRTHVFRRSEVEVVKVRIEEALRGKA